MSDLDAHRITLRSPRPADAPAVWKLVRDSDILDTNSLYYYNLWFRDFADTSIVAATSDEQIVGFVTAYVRPDLPDTLMAWQSAVDPGQHAPGLAVRMMHELADRAAQRGATCLETTINPGNRAVALMLRRFAHERGLDIHTEVLFAAENFPGDGTHTHAPEVLYRMTPAVPAPARPGTAAVAAR
ncbi:diaminobutyrate acetyltransferase [Streptomyces sp. SID12501]|uniref:L-2,4-diaminobutyric acid acetyltransferase n=1 Tax=Streptomyces sp. SID12501 TaxID=2706042 RepID=A0A6B3BGX2_9ACTN|nr:diaminobutyrate acetyltransferase [Streptomyces sp. SID12501]NEC84951.1 diaminobutyrate acetyltransferase [Streptomyces sp. SID12501]